MEPQNTPVSKKAEKEASIEPKLTKEYVELSRQYGMNSIYLKEILILRQRGLNNKEIAQQTGISPTTIGAYMDKLNTLDRKEVLRITVLALVAVAGLAVVKGLLGDVS